MQAEVASLRAQLAAQQAASQPSARWEPPAEDSSAGKTTASSGNDADVKRVLEENRVLKEQLTARLADESREEGPAHQALAEAREYAETVKVPPTTRCCGRT